MYLCKCFAVCNNKEKDIDSYQYNNVHKAILNFIITNLCNICITDSAVAASSPVVGSSRNNMPGDTTISMAMLHRFLCPPDTPRESGVPIYNNMQRK